VIAGAGAGKTKTLAHRVAHLVVNGIDPHRILLLTFSRRAAIDMTGRVNRITAAALGTGEIKFPTDPRILPRLRLDISAVK
jgi:DNA helicase II / ATP-dependent DNA helicase PcrA